MKRGIFPRGLGGIIYDCDGVMINSRAANDAYFNKVLAYFGLPPMTPEQEAYTFMASGLDGLRHILPPELHKDIGRVTREAVIYERDILPLLRLMPGFVDFVTEMHGRGLPQAIATNRTGRGLRKVLDFFALPPYFNPVITVSNAEPKPSGDGVSKICAAWGADPGRVLLVGDSDNDKRAAEAGGVVFAAFNGGDLEGGIAVSDYAGLRRALAPCLPARTANEKVGTS